MRAIQYKVIPLGWGTCRWLRYFYRNCLLSSMNGLSLRDVPVPELPGDDWVRVKTRLGGICGSDVSILLQKQPPDSILQAFSSMPVGLGHENVAEVQDVGSNVSRTWIGKRVLVEPTLSCVARGTEPKCARCREEQYGACENFSGIFGGSFNMPAGTSTGYNSRTGGSWGEYFVAHKSQLVAVDDSLADEQAVLIDPVACSLHALFRADLSQASNILVYGAGVLGIGTIASLRALGYQGRIDVIDRHRFLEEIVLAQGADEYMILPATIKERFETIASRTDGALHRVRFGNYMLSGGYDIVIDCVGSAGSVTESLKWTRARGQVVMLGTMQKGLVDLTPLWFRELNMIGTYGRQMENYLGQKRNTYEIVHDWLVDGLVNFDGLLTHTFPLSDYKNALKTVLDKSRTRSVKVAFDFRG